MRPKKCSHAQNEKAFQARLAAAQQQTLRAKQQALETVLSDLESRRLAEILRAGDLGES